MKSLLNLSCLRIAGAFLMLSAALQAQRLSSDGPYIWHQADQSTRVVRVDAEGSIRDTVFRALPADYAFPVTDHAGKYTFRVRLHPVERPEWEDKQPEKVLVMSDPHGKLDCVVTLLQGNGVIDRELGWSFGRNHLMVIGDVFDRGEDVPQIFWLLYKLEEEAQKAGGKVTFLLGNHETMVTAGDLRYTKAKYKALADTLHIDYPQFFSPQTELGHWLATRNTMHRIGNDLYVHAGLGKDFYDRHLDIPTVNREMSRGLFHTKKERKADSPLQDFLFTSGGPVWYRGLVSGKEKYNPCPVDTLQMILERYGAERLFVGHTVFDDISTFYGGKVIGVNVDNEENREKGKGRAVLIENGTYFVVGDRGKIRRLF